MRGTSSTSLGGWPQKKRRGSLLLTAMLIAVSVGIGLAGYLNLSRNALKLSQRTYFLNCATNLAEAGLEEAVYCYRLMDSGTSIESSWTGWKLSSSNASLTLPSFSLGQNGVGVVKVFVTGYDGNVTNPTAVAQAQITPLDGSPTVTKSLKVTMKKNGSYNAAIITKTSLSLGAKTIVDSFNSNPTGGSGADRLTYPGKGATANGHLIALAGSISLGSNGLVNGNVLLGSGVTAPSKSLVNGSIITNYAGVYPAAPSLPSWSLSTGYYGLFSLPGQLPREGDVPAADGRYYYYPAILVNPLSVTDTTITDKNNVTLIATSIAGRLSVDQNATCIVWTGDISTSGSKGFENSNWSGALQIYSWGKSIALGQNASTSLCLYAPLATVTLTGGGSSPRFTGSIVANSFSCSGQWAIHYDESLNTASTQAGTGWALATWSDLQGTAESLQLGSVTSNFLR